MSGDGRMQGKVGLIVGVANHRSLAWAIAQAVAAEGARVPPPGPGAESSAVRACRIPIDAPPHDAGAHPERR